MNLVAFNALLNGTAYSAIFVTADSIANKNRKNYWKSWAYIFSKNFLPCPF